ncbi:MAG TPA: HAD-IA family hydrolase [Vicinamibacterales bacterium]|nr:HAD-IA family hydrolase [Vicinamibacterales bacterium]
MIVFDLDGTLIDSRQDLADAANALIVERGGRPLPSDAVGRMVGEGAAMLVRRALDAAGLPLDTRSVPRFLELYDERLLDTTYVYPGLLPVVEELSRRSPMAIVTNKPLAPTRKLVEALGLQPFFRSVIGGDGPFPRKPDPSSLRHLMQEYGATAGQTVMVGDSRIDFETARAAGTAICLVRFGFGYETFPAGLLSGDEGLADAPRQLPAIIERLLESRRQSARESSSGR